MYLIRTAQNHAITHFHVLAMISELSRGFAAMPVCDGVNGLFCLFWLVLFYQSNISYMHVFFLKKDKSFIQPSINYHSI